MCGSMVDIQSAKSVINARKKEEEEELKCGPNAQRYGRPAEYRWRPLFNATKFG